jgi:hypothetical protein
MMQLRDLRYKWAQFLAYMLAAALLTYSFLWVCLQLARTS